jgi:CheY-like chemotaxis protein
VLIVCDEPVTQKSCAEVVGREGHRAVVTSSGDEALALLERQPIDLARERPVPR